MDPLAPTYFKDPNPGAQCVRTFTVPCRCGAATYELWSDTLREQWHILHREAIGRITQRFDIDVWHAERDYRGDPRKVLPVLMKDLHPPSLYDLRYGDAGKRQRRS